jgi:hypothetical protein
MLIVFTYLNSYLSYIFLVRLTIEDGAERLFRNIGN